jgi:predicted outer membrane repeat protein
VSSQKNSATSFGAGAGAIWSRFGALSVSNTTFSDNSANSTGGAILSSAETTLITNTTFVRNNALDGGAFANDGGQTASIINSTFSLNSSGAAGHGGAIFGGGGTIKITNSTFSGNSGQPGGAIYNSTAGVTRFKSNILAGSVGGNCSGVIADAGWNIADDSSCGLHAIGSHNNTDPKLDPAGLSDNGGPTQTIALLTGSPAIGAIPVTDCTDLASPAKPIHTDQRGAPRPDSGEGACDIGAYEFQDNAFLPLSRFSSGVAIDSNAGVFHLGATFTLAPSGNIDPPTEAMMLSVGSYSVTLPAGSFVKVNGGYVYEKTVNGILLSVFIRFTKTPGTYILLAKRGEV